MNRPCPFCGTTHLRICRLCDGCERCCHCPSPDFCVTVDRSPESIRAAISTLRSGGSIEDAPGAEGLSIACVRLVRGLGADRTSVRGEDLMREVMEATQQ